MKFITRRVWILSIISLLTDAASEMLYPIMPLYLKSIGFSVALIGILEGIAEAVVGLSKGYFGKLSDLNGKRVPFVQTGYALSAIAKPLMVLYTGVAWIFFARTMDRLGKGVRTAARDAILSEDSDPQNKGKIFGFHRSMDTLGAVLGPVIALLFLKYNSNDYSALFYIAFIPGIMAVFLSFLLKEKKSIHTSLNIKTSFLSFLNYWKSSPAEYKKVVTVLLLFAIFNSSDFFLLLKARQSGLNEDTVIWIYLMYNLVYALFSYPMGLFSDKVGIKKIFLLGLIMFSAVYFGIALSTSQSFIVLMFILYGIYASATEGISKAWISKIAEKKDIATAMGTYAAFQSLCALIASSLTGLLWFYFGSSVALLSSGIAALFVSVYFLFITSNE
jgi:MFS family permease